MENIRIPIPAVAFHPPVYPCRRASRPFIPDGRLDKPFWEDAPFTDEFLDIEGSHMPKPRFSTRAKILWDDETLYIGAVLEGSEIWGSVTQRDDVIFRDNDFEIFIDPDSDTRQYYEFEMNVLNTVWDLFLPVAYRDGGSALNGYDIHGLKTAVAVNGRSNDPDAQNLSWSVEVAIPFSAITECVPGRRPPKAGDYYRLNFSRVQWKVDVKDGRYQKRTDEAGRPLPEDNWVWSPTGVINIHYPELWGFVFFTDDAFPADRCVIPKEEAVKWELRKLYYAQQIYRDLHGSYCDDLQKLCSVLKDYAPNAENSGVKPLPFRVETTSHGFEISCRLEDGKSAVIFSDGKTSIAGQ